MVGTKAGGLKAAATNRERYGEDFYRRLGHEGGQNGHTGGFGSKKVGKDGLPAARKMPKVIAPNSGLEFEDFSYRKKQNKKAFRKCSCDERTDCKVCFTAIISIAVVGLVVILGVMASSWNIK